MNKLRPAEGRGSTKEEMEWRASIDGTSLGGFHTVPDYVVTTTTITTTTTTTPTTTDGCERLLII